MLNFQDESGMWYQVVKKSRCEKNYLETSGSAIMVYSLLKGIRVGFLDASYAEYGIRALGGIINRYLDTKEGGMSLGGICLVAGLDPENNTRRDGSYDYYLSEPVVKDDAKGVGTFLLAYTEKLRI